MSMDEEKLPVEQSELGSGCSNPVNGKVAIDETRVRSILRRIDIRLLPILGFLYTISLIDRANISVARISGLDEDLDLGIGSRASIALLVFFIGYILFEIPSNILIRRIGAANLIAFIVFSWGLISIGSGFCQSWIPFAVCRALLGVLEAGFFPGCVYLVSSWYCRYEVQKRLAGFFMFATALSSLGNILAYGIIQIANYTTYSGWRWIYIVEGSITSLVGFLSWFIIVDFPDSHRTTFLSKEEIAFVKARLDKDRGKGDSESVTWDVIKDTFRDWKVWSFGFMYMSGAIGSYAFTLFLPTILENSLNFSTQLAFILAAPPALWSVIQAMTVSWLADRLQLRGPFVFGSAVVGIAGLAMIGFLESPWPRYVGAFLGEGGCNGLIVTLLAWQQNSIVGDAKRSVATAVQITLSGVGGIYSSLVFREQDAPKYVPGIIACMAVLIVTMILAVVTSFALRVSNRKADTGMKMIAEALPEFRYTL